MVHVHISHKQHNSNTTKPMGPMIPLCVVLCVGLMIYSFQRYGETLSQPVPKTKMDLFFESCKAGDFESIQVSSPKLGSLTRN